MRRLLCSPHILGGVFLFTLLCVALAGAKYYTRPDTVLIVTTTADNGPGSLRDTLAATGDGDTIQFDSTLNGQAITLTSGELPITHNITISGPGANLLTVKRSSSAGTNFRIFHVMPSLTVTIQGLTISDGN